MSETKKTSKAPARSPASTPRVRGLTNGIHAEQLYIEPLIPSGQQSKLQKMQQPPKRAKREEVGHKAVEVGDMASSAYACRAITETLTLVTSDGMHLIKAGKNYKFNSI